MERGYLIDTNTVIDYLDSKLPSASLALIDNSELNLSVITRIELLVWRNATVSHLKTLQDFIAASHVYPLDEPVILKSIEIRKDSRIKLPGAIIAATAIIYDLTLVSRNLGGFQKCC